MQTYPDVYTYWNCEISFKAKTGKENWIEVLYNIPVYPGKRQYTHWSKYDGGDENHC